MKVQGSTQMPAAVPQSETNGVQRTSKKDKADAANGPASSTNNQERTPPSVQPRNPAAEQKFEGQRIAADLNARFDSANGANKNAPTKPDDPKAYFDLEWEADD
jgi:hypothetical protein